MNQGEWQSNSTGQASHEEEQQRQTDHNPNPSTPLQPLHTQLYHSSDRRSSLQHKDSSHRRHEQHDMLLYSSPAEDEGSYHLPSLSTLGHTPLKERMGQREGHHQKISPLPRRSSPAVMVRPYLEVSPSSSSPTTPSTSRADKFMASLLRAAQSPDVLSPHHSPMSVHSIVESSTAPATAQSRPKKRRTSSVQEPLQGSALAALRKSHSSSAIHSPRRSQTPSEYLNRQRQNTAMTASNIRDTDTFRSTPSYMSVAKFAPPSSPRMQQRASTGRPSYQPSEWDRLQQQQTTTLSPHQRLSSANHSQHSSTSSSSSSYHPTPLHRPAGSPSTPHEGGSVSIPSPSAPGTWEAMTTTSSSATSSRVTPTSGAGLSNVLGKRSAWTNYEHWNHQFASKSLVEEQRWADLSVAEKREVVRENILLAREDLINVDNAQWTQRSSSLVTKIRCMYANIAQKSYGSEKRFLCPPPVVKIGGPMRSCKWVCVRVTSGDSPTPNSLVGGMGGTGASGEEETLLDVNREARFGKLHVGSLSDSRSKTFRLQISLLRFDSTSDGRQKINRSEAIGQATTHPSSVIPTNAWASFHSSPISVISKPARKSVRTRAASPAIASGATVCLYNRLNSQTVRTKYLAVDTAGEGGSGSEGRPLVARQDGWEGFSIELLARPLNDPAVARASMRGLNRDDWGITYGSIICLRDINTNLCSDPILICKVDKGRVEMSSLTGGASSDGRVRFQIVAKDREAAKRILLGGMAKEGRGQEESRQDVDASRNAAMPMRRGESVESSNGSNSAATPVNNLGEANGSTGGAVIQMQKVTLMLVSPKPCSMYSDEIECDLSEPRAYLCSTAFEGPPDRHTTKSFARSMAKLDARFQARQQGQDERMLVEEEREGGARIPADSSPSSAGSSSSHCPVGYVRPPWVTVETIMGPSQVDLLEDPFCWTVVTISRSDVSYLEANIRPPLGSPHVPSSPLPITPLPSLAAHPSYDVQRHAIAATIHDFLYCEDPLPVNVNNVCISNDAKTKKSAHEVWLAHSGPLAAQSTSAGPSMCDVTSMLPTVDHLLTLHRTFHGLAINAQIDVINLPILFVRPGQGITFVTSRWLRASIKPGQSTWSFTVV